MTIENVTASKNLDLKRVFERVRSQVHRLLEGGASPSDISFALAYIAAELGFVVAPDSLCVVTVVLNAISQAASQQWESKQSQKDNNLLELQTVHPGETIH